MKEDINSIKENWKIGFLIFPDITVLDLVGPYEILSRVFSNCILIAENESIVSSNTDFKLIPDYSFGNAPILDILVVPGGPGQTPTMNNPLVIDFIKKKYAEVKFIASVCTGTLLLAKAGILEGKAATTHWLATQELSKYNSIYTPKRVVWDGNIISGAGVSSGIDMALELVETIFGTSQAESIQLAIEYDPQPPHDCGSPDKAPPELVDKLKKNSRFHKKQVTE